jgi:plastocyanin
VTVVVLESTQPIPPSPQSEMPVMDQRNLTFIPHVLLVRTGQPAAFLNNDEELHNLNVKDSATRHQVFNVAIPTDGKYVHVLEEDGIYDVTCDIHPGMSAQIFAVSTPYATVADADGNFAFAGVTPGQYRARVFAGAKVIERTIEIAGGRVDLDLTSQ